ncbi:MAG: hypothetical protein PVF50_12730 [Gammaproteobacteria bacterium]|jgi:hypothetical protein
MNRIRHCGFALCGLILLGGLASAEMISGLEVGAPTVSIPVLDVTGAYAGKRICYVCEFQDDPNVLAFFRDTGDATADLIIQLNELYLERKDENFKAVAAIVAGEEAAPWLEALNARANIEIPLVVLRRGPKDVAVRLYALNPEVDNTFLVTVNRFVSANVSAIEPDQFDQVVEATAQMLAGL